MFEVYKFPMDFVPFWHLGARMCVGRFARSLRRIEEENKGTVSLLDAGSGGGWHTLLAASMGLNVSCIDISPASIENTIKFSKRMGIEGRIYACQGDCYALPFGDHRFDVVVSSHVIEHLEQPERMLREIRRVLKPGGVLLLFCPSLYQGMRLSRWLGMKLDPPDHKVMGYDKEGLISIMPEGFRLRSITCLSRFFESNVMDIQIVLARALKVKANPGASEKKPDRMKRRNGPLFFIVYSMKELVLVVSMLVCKIENTLFSYTKGSSIFAEIELLKDNSRTR